MNRIAAGGGAPETVARLLAAWRGEVEARAIYEALAAREPDRDRAAILLRMADGEGGHRARIEVRLGELGVPTPDPASVRLTLWTRLQLRFAPVEKVLAWREAMEDRETDDTYARATGNRMTYALFGHLRKDERSNALAVEDMRSAAPPAVPGEDPPGRLRRILGRETWHKTGSSWISGAVYGANDGLAAVFGIVAGVSGATGGASFVLTAGLAGAIASALSMAVGAYLAERSTSEVAAANVERERQEIVEHPDEEREEVSLFYQLKGIDKETGDRLAGQMAHNPGALLQLHAPEELGGAETTGRPVQAAIAAG